MKHVFGSAHLIYYTLYRMKIVRAPLISFSTTNRAQYFVSTENPASHITLQMAKIFIVVDAETG